MKFKSIATANFTEITPRLFMFTHYKLSELNDGRWILELRIFRSFSRNTGAITLFTGNGSFHSQTISQDDLLKNPGTHSVFFHWLFDRCDSGPAWIGKELTWYQFQPAVLSQKNSPFIKQFLWASQHFMDNHHNCKTIPVSLVTKHLYINFAYAYHSCCKHNFASCSYSAALFTVLCSSSTTSWLDASLDPSPRSLDGSWWLAKPSETW